MLRDFTIRRSISLVQSPYELDLHNHFEFQGLRYSVRERTLLLQWHRREGVPPSIPASVAVEFRGVTEYRFLPRDSTLPFTEDDCVNTFGYWTDEDWTDGVFDCAPTEVPDARWLTAIDFMSGAVIVVQSDTAHATIVA